MNRCVKVILRLVYVLLFISNRFKTCPSLEHYFRMVFFFFLCSFSTTQYHNYVLLCARLLYSISTIEFMLVYDRLAPYARCTGFSLRLPLYDIINVRCTVYTHQHTHTHALARMYRYSR